MKLSPCLSLIAALLLMAGWVSVRADNVDDYLMAQMKKNYIPGLAVAIVQNGQVLKLKGYGQANLEWDAVVTPDTTFQLASSTKPLTGTALMMLVEEGKIALDDRVAKYLPGAPPAWRDITIRDLATHSSGISDDLGGGKVETVAEAVKAAAAHPLVYQPGERSAYALMDFVVLTQVMERVTGKPFTAFLRERLFEPLGMNETQFDEMVENGPARVSRPVRYRASVYNWEGGRQQTFSFLYPSWTYSAGGLYSSASDLAKWVVALDTGRILKGSSLEQMWASRKLKDGRENSFGIGWVVKTYHGRKAVGHSGGPALSDILRFPGDKLSIIVLTNQERLFPRLAEGIADLYVPAPPLRGSGGVEDDDQKTTVMLKGVLVDAAQGRVNEALFVPEARKGFVPAFREFGPVYFSSLDPLESFVLIEQSWEGDRRVRRYRALFGKKPIIWRFELSKEGKIITMEPTSE